MIGTDQLERLKEALLSLKSIPRDQQRDWIDRRLGDDPELRAEVISLLRASTIAAPTTFDPLFVFPKQAGGSGVLPERIGPYAIESLLGQGGMATVYRARQSSPVERVLAVKVLRPGTYTPGMMARFAAERRTIARLEHRNIARLLDAGEDDTGRPYVAMELIDGPSLTEYVRIHRLGLRERLEQFVQVCRGVQHAHARGFLHRDLKPSNILISEEDTGPVPKVIDFGVSTAVLDHAQGPRQTLSGEVLGTVEYMSPEQADPCQPVPDVRCDVYSLGIVLYELLTDTLPFQEAQLRGKTSAQIHSFLTTQRPEAPSKRNAERARQKRAAKLSEPLTVPIDLDFVTLKAIAADPEVRYGSVREFSDDIERWLRGEPVHARAPSSLYIAKRFVQRHRLATGAAVIVLLALTGSLSVVAVSLNKVKHERDRVQHSLQESEEIVEQLRRSYFVVLPSDMGPDVKVHQMLVQMGERLLQDPPKSPFVRAQMAQALAEPLYELGESALAERLTTLAVEGFRADIAAGFDPTHRREAPAFNALSTLASINYADLRPREAKALFEEALGMARRVNDPQLIVGSRLRLAAVHEQLMDLERAVQTLQDTLTELPTAPESDRKRIVVKALLIQMLVQLDRPADAVRLAEEVIAAREGEQRIKDTSLPAIRNCYGWALSDVGRLPEAISVLQKSVSDCTTLLGPNAASTEAARVLLARARLMQSPGSDVKAELPKLLEEIQEKEKSSPGIAETWQPILVECLLKAGLQNEALSAARDYIDHIDPNPDLKNTAQFNIGRALAQGGASREAIPPLESAYEGLSKNLSPSSWACRKSASLLAGAFASLGDSAKAELWKAKAEQATSN